MGVRALLLAVILCACGPTRKHGSGADAPGPTETDDDGDSYTESAGDCNDMDATVHPGASEVCGDSVDNNCNGQTDRSDYECFTECEKAAYDRSSVGCVYYAVDTNALGGPFAVAVSNINATATANVVIEVKNNGVWAPVQNGTFTVMPKSLHTHNLTRRYITGSAIYAGGAYRITSDLPVISYQFAPIDGASSFLSDASLLLPVSALDKYYIVSAWPYGVDQGGTARPSHIQIAASEPTTVTVTSPIATVAGSGVPALQPNAPGMFTLAEGDYLQLTVQNVNQSFTGAYIEADKPIAVFSSNDCANVPNIPSKCCCDHLEEQLFGLQTWGTSYVATQMPRRQMEGSIWQILAQQNGTTVTFTAPSGVTGLPPSVVLDARQMVEYEVIGGSTPGDFLIESDKPILVNQFTVGSFHVQNNSNVGDPDMVQVVPTQQFLYNYTVLVPSTWVNDFLIMTRKAGSTVMVDGAVPMVTWHPVPGGWETAVMRVADGVHTLEGSLPFGVSVSGYDTYDSYAYPGGLDQRVINPIL